MAEYKFSKKDLKEARELANSINLVLKVTPMMEVSYKRDIDGSAEVIIHRANAKPFVVKYPQNPKFAAKYTAEKHD